MLTSLARRRVAVTGASGFIGRALVERLIERGYGVIALGRSAPADPFPAGVEFRRFDPGAQPQPSAFEGADAVVHLAAESVAGRWTLDKKHAILTSRVAGTRCVVASLAQLARPPSVLACASGTGYYGSRGDLPLEETTEAGTDFLARVCIAWEREANAAAAHGIRAVQLRTGIVLGRGGALAAMAPAFRVGAGGPFGAGSQFVPWIHLDDLTAMYLFVLERNGIAGAVNAVTPDYATSARFAQALGAALHRPALVPAPSFALRAALGEFAQTLLGSQLVLPARAQDAEFRWTRPYLEDALADVYGTQPWLVVKTFSAEQFLPHPPESVFPFFADAGNLEAITPASLRFRIRSVAPEMRRGALIRYALSLHGVPFRWKTMIARWDPPHGFEDVQLHGPYALWHHSHSFVPVDGGTLMTDRVRYALPLYPLGEVARSLVSHDVKEIFAHRRVAIERLSATSGGT